MNQLETPQTHDSDDFQVPTKLIFSDITRQLYQAASPGIVANALLGVVLVWSLWGSVSQDYALYWLGANIVTNLSRLLLAIYVKKSGFINEQNWKRWATLHVVTTGIISLVWGFAAVLFYVKGNIAFQVFFTLIVAGMSSAALPIVGIYLPSYLAYTLPALLPLIGVFLVQGGKLHMEIAVLLIIFVLTMLTTARRYSAKIIESTKLRIQFDMLAHIDVLTGLANRRAFDIRLDGEWRRTMRVGDRLSLMIIDIDNFKEYNDHFGHQEGDNCLKLIGKTIGEVFQRGGDFAARLGGDEFVAIIPVNDNVTELAEKVRLAVFALGLRHPNQDKDFVTISVGLSTTIPNCDLSPSALYGAADAALYTTKKNGRNSVFVRNLDVPLKET